MSHVRCCITRSGSSHVRCHITHSGLSSVMCHKYDGAPPTSTPFGRGESCLACKGLCHMLKQRLTCSKLNGSCCMQYAGSAPARAPPQACTVSCNVVKCHINASMLGICNSVTVTHYVKSRTYVLGVLCWATSSSGAGAPTLPKPTTTCKFE